MINWIEVVEGTLPPNCLDVLLYVVILHEDKESLFDETIICGFYDEEEKKWAHIKPNNSWEHFEENAQLRVVAWTLPPSYFDYEKYKQERKKFGLDLFKKW